MSRKGLAWALLVFALTLLAGLPARWLSPLLPWPVEALSGTVWQGQAARVGAVGPLNWRLRPWAAQVQAAYQGQRWQVEWEGWPWNWQFTAQPLGAAVSVTSVYRLSGDWQGRVQVRGVGRRCVAAEGRIAVNELALVAPWSLALGRGEVRVECGADWRVLVQLELAGQHALALQAGIAGGTLEGQVETGAAVYPLLVGGQWLQPGSQAMRRTFRW